MSNSKFALVCYIIYIVMYMSLIWGITISLIYFLNWSSWIAIITILAQADMNDLSEFKQFIQDDKEV